jgi:hypothetical protein
MFISLTNSRSIGFKKRSDQHPHGSNDDDQPGGATPNAATSPPIETEAINQPGMPALLS